MRHVDPVGTCITLLRSILIAIVIIVVMMTTKAYAFQPGQMSNATFMGCDTEEDAKTYITAYLARVSIQETTCGVIRGSVSVYLRKVSTLNVAGGVATIHEVAVPQIEIGRASCRERV